MSWKEIEQKRQQAQEYLTQALQEHREIERCDWGTDTMIQSSKALATAAIAQALEESARTDIVLQQMEDDAAEMTRAKAQLGQSVDRILEGLQKASEASGS